MVTGTIKRLLKVNCMTNKEISSIFNETYNLFWMKWRDNVPLRAQWRGYPAERGPYHQAEAWYPLGQEVGRPCPNHGRGISGSANCQLVHG